MSTIFIANPTLQHRELHVRVNKEHLRILRIRAGGQEKFPDELEGTELAKVLRQLDRAGAVPETDPKAIKNRFSLLYKVTETPKPITTPRIDAAAEQDKDVRQDLAGDALEQAGVAAFNSARAVGGSEVSFELTQVTDEASVKGGVDTEITVSGKRNVKGGRSSTRRR